MKFGIYSSIPVNYKTTAFAIYDEDGTEGRFADRRVHTTFLQRVHPSARTFRCSSDTSAAIAPTSAPPSARSRMVRSVLSWPSAA